MAGVLYTTLYFPMPDTSDKAVVKNRGYKLKYYTSLDEPIETSSLRSVFERLHADGYTHVANMPGQLNDICYNARCFHMIVIDKRLIKQIAGLCASVQ